MLKGLGPMRLAAIAGAGVSILGFFIYIMSRVAAPQMELLYGELDLNDSKAMVEKLQADKVPFEVRKDGTEIWVPKDKKNEMRVKLAEQAVPSGGRIAGYELFDKQDALGTTSFQQNINYVRAMEGELARTIRAIDKVKVARVHLVLPQREAFSRESGEPSASVILKMAGNARLERGQVVAIQHLIAAAVPKMKPSRISVIDDKGTLLAKGTDNERQLAAETADQMRLATEGRLARVIEDLLERTLGPGRVRAEVAVEMDMSRAVTTEEVFDPESKVVRSEVNVNEDSSNSEGEPPSVSVTQNLPDTNNSNGTTRSQSKATKNQTTTNYEITKKTKNTVRELAEIKKVSAAVLVDGIYEKAADGTKTYRDRTDKEKAQIIALVKSAIGYTKDRDDQVTVETMQFAGGEEQYQAEEPGEFIFGMRRDFVEKVASNLGLSVVAILFLLLVLRPLITRAIEGMQAGAVGPDGRRLLAGEGGMVPQLAGPGGAPLPAPALGGEEEVIADELIDIDKVEGRVKASSIRKIGEIVEKHPEEALSILRTWLYAES
jgi:flagellar M-ring protein FliF